MGEWIEKWVDGQVGRWVNWGKWLEVGGGEKDWKEGQAPQMDGWMGGAVF